MKAMEGWVKIHRKLLEWEHYRNGNVVRLFLHLLMTANIEDKEWNGMTIKRGQVVTSIAKLANELGLTPMQVRTSKITLKLTGEITIKTTSRFSVITICKFDDYQVCEQKQQQAGQQAKQQAKQQQLKKNNRKKEIIKTSTNVDAKRPSFVEPAFEEPFSMWLEYKHQRNETYKSETSLKVCYNRLVRYAGGDPETAKAIVEQSMANNWAGLYELKEENGNGNNQQRKKQQPGQIPGGPQPKNPLAGYDKIIGA